ncbi:MULTISPECIES: copper homeostasis periplasmic binding protein CopC [Caulobacter]|jgi:methionine-rich copper-binding protein CopC|uniref:copper homeostasis periplasmic binding protein CopC n=1 Tax=Caulobacter TaxID=75 RepID=UPI000783D7BD|nr:MULTISPECIES: copper homeostasis periplasmic binding protein CopC [Caulobacter]ATC24404.1 copper resistance protein CopC [Caulobacter vibrioides]MBQ1561752.1 copper homeostasis periplasmic binding protein CopC [Caulobacter sp.]MCK5910089.1 copper homeostasis periplasmic binding protein CopC [Caulobacter sp.]PIC00026.1 copper resistance protein CopC [Caulobacter sp. X]
MKVRALLLTVMAVSALAAGQASAHAKLVSSNPAAAATVAAPKTITLTFNEKLAPAFSSFELAMADGMKVPVKTTVSKDRKSISGTPQGKLMPGGYKITWRAAAGEDGHRMDGVVAFTVK